MENGNGREQWQTQLGFVLAAIGSAIGLGNIWRFSYMAYSNGGGAFLIPYLFALFTAGIPLLILEFALGHERMGSAPLACTRVKRGWEWLGWWAVTLVMFGIELYYVVIIAWCVCYFFLSFSLGWGADPNAYFFKHFLALSKSAGQIGVIRTPILAALIAVWVINWGIVYRGVGKGLEKANKIFMPLLFIFTAILVFWSLTLPGALDGIKAYLTPNLSKIMEPKVWIDAYSQIFFTLSLGFGIMIAYASYLPGKSDLTKNAVITAGVNCGYSLFAGFAVFSVLGFMAASQGKSIADVVSQSIGLAFVAYPKAVSMMPGGPLFGAIFFLCLVMAGISSSISIMEAFVSAIVDKFNVGRKMTVSVVSAIGVIGSLIFTTQAGLYWLDIADHFLTHYGIVVVGILEAIMVGWFFDTKHLRRYINKNSTMRLGAWWDVTVKFVVPLVLGIILLGDISKEVQKPYGGYGWTPVVLIGLNWVLSTVIAGFLFASRPWKDKCPLEVPRENQED